MPPWLPGPSATGSHVLTPAPTQGTGQRRAVLGLWPLLCGNPQAPPLRRLVEMSVLSPSGRLACRHGGSRLSLGIGG